MSQPSILINWVVFCIGSEVVLDVASIDFHDFVESGVELVDGFVNVDLRELIPRSRNARPQSRRLSGKSLPYTARISGMNVECSEQQRSFWELMRLSKLTFFRLREGLVHIHKRQLPHHSIRPLQSLNINIGCVDSFFLTPEVFTDCGSYNEATDLKV